MTPSKKIIIVDDDPINNLICTMTIKSVFKEADTRAFSEPEAGLAFIKDEFINSLNDTVLFLDLNMPNINGWEFMEHYENFSDLIKDHINVYILSSSLDQRDKDKADANKYIKGFISKPLDQETVLSLVG